MLDSSLSHTRAALDQIFGRYSSKFRHLRSSSWLATATIEDPTKISDYAGTGDASIAEHVPSATQRRNLDFRSRIPPGSWDSHMHVLDPRFPLSPQAVYTPSPTAPTRLQHANAFEADVGLDNIVLVQPSIYGYDNSCLLDALQSLGPDRARGVVAFEDPALWAAREGLSACSSSSSLSSTSTGQMSSELLKEWHELGVRGVRINLQSHGQKDVSADDFRSLLRRYIEIVKPFGWVVQVYVAIDMVHILEPLVAEYKNGKDNQGVKLCIDHMGHPHLSQLAEYQATRDPYTIPGFDALVRLLETGIVYVKMSAAYRFSAEMEDAATSPRDADTASRDVWPIASELLRVAGMSRVVFATDWPHTRYDGLDIRPWMQSVVDLCGADQELVERVFRGNAEDLWSVKRLE
ncbi:uncharacterized protein B0I36DRAFT_363201 [Microdochium trichocladiopsis]|uniref:Amidohydrolase-related domain-containing protein n=1 Tax=Microdochium trichocladiopsis TaxID=1682393 RepID=A0A9P9BR58_9PEZI|nr:uncharacterized protein B0I36DRAFT_363201 [Microdochium trichocladiopsis]KAH7031520.1 hypothetical protein B0I36DRAFT_363201 [Microdochium trichocladiopsis]